MSIIQQISTMPALLSQMGQTFLLGPILPKLSVNSVDLSGKTAVVTGGNTGLGFEIARQIAGMGAEVVLACRNLDKAAKARQQLQSLTLKGRIEVMQLDCSNLASVADFASTWGSRKLDMLFLNAGVWAESLEFTEEGYEASFVTNVLSEYALIARLLPAMSQKGRIILTTSAAQWALRDRKAVSDPENDMDAARYLQKRSIKLGQHLGEIQTPMYGRGKLLQVGLARQMQRQLDAHPVYAAKDLAILSFHPGMIRTALWDTTGAASVSFASRYGISAEQGASTGVWLAITKKVKKGGYYFRQSHCTAAPLATDSKLMARHFKAWERATGLSV